MADDKEQPKNGKQPTPPIETTLTSVSGSLAALLIKKNLEKGGKAEIPSLGIKIEKK